MIGAYTYTLMRSGRLEFISGGLCQSDQLEEAFAEGVLVGHPDMPEFTLSAEDIDALLSYIQSVQERRGAKIQ